LAIGFQLAVQDRRGLVAIGALALIAPVVLLLPGGDGLLDRFRGDSVECAGERAPVSGATLPAYVDGSVRELLLGKGFHSSSRTVLRATAIHTSSHNAFLTMLHEYGAVGLALFLALHAFCILGGLRSQTSTGLMATALTVFLLG